MAILTDDGRVNLSVDLSGKLSSRLSLCFSTMIKQRLTNCARQCRADWPQGCEEQFLDLFPFAGFVALNSDKKGVHCMCTTCTPGFHIRWYDE